MKRLLLSVFPLWFLVGCAPATIKTITLQPSAINSSNWYSDTSSFYCDVPLPGQGLSLQGLGPEPVGPGQIYSGYEDIFQPGSDPFPCTYRQRRLYRGQVAFDLSQFDNVAVAILTFNVDQSIHENGGVTNDRPADGYATTLGMSTGTSDTGNGPFYWNYDNDASFSCNSSIIKPDCSIAVGQQVRQWVTNAHVNDGFIIAGPILDFSGDLPSDNNGQLSWYSGFQLQVTYNTALNPRAPQ